MEPHFTSFKTFWPFYLSQHSHRMCRGLHYFGTTLALAWLIFCLVTPRFSWIPVGFIFGYGPAWVGHFGFERNRPATFTYPRWSFIADFKMLYLFFTGRLGKELQRHQVEILKFKTGG